MESNAMTERYERTASTGATDPLVAAMLAQVEALKAIEKQLAIIAHKLSYHSGAWD